MLLRLKLKKRKQLQVRRSVYCHRAQQTPPSSTYLTSEVRKKEERSTSQKSSHNPGTVADICLSLSVTQEYAVTSALLSLDKDKMDVKHTSLTMAPATIDEARKCLRPMDDLVKLSLYVRVYTCCQQAIRYADEGFP